MSETPESPKKPEAPAPAAIGPGRTTDTENEPGVPKRLRPAPGPAAWFWARGVPILAFFGGLAIVGYNGWSIYEYGLQERAHDQAMITISANTNAINGPHEFGGEFSPIIMTLRMMAGATLACVSSILIFRRLSLVRLILFVFLIGIAGALPQWFKPTVGSQDHIFYRANRVISEAQIAQVSEAVKPSVALATAPPEFLKVLELRSPGDAIRHVELIREALHVTIQFEPDVDLRTRKALVHFYTDYFELQMRKLLIAEGAPPAKIQYGLELESVWTKYESEWRAQNDPALPMPAPPPPTPGLAPTPK